MIDESVLDETAKIMAADPSGMLEKVENLPKMLEEGFVFGQRTSLPAAASKNKGPIVVCGMGGSGVSGIILADYAWEKCDRSVVTVRNYVLPQYIDSKSTVFALSYSGDTEETLSATKEALKRGAQVIAITSGGKLQEIAVKEKLPLVMIPGGLPPRAALGYLLGALLGVAEPVLKINSLKDDFKETMAELRKIREENSSLVSRRVSPAKKLALRIADKIPVVFGTEGLNDSVSYRWKTQLNENSKQTALAVNFPELDHNEIVNLSVLKKDQHAFALVVLRDDKDTERIKKRIEITKSLIGIQMGGINEVVARGESKLSRIMSLIYLGDFVSVYSAYLRGFDPSPVDVITRLKKELNR